MTEQTENSTPSVPFLPSAGRVILARNKVAETQNGVYIPEDKRKRLEEMNIRAQVVAVGKPEITDYGETIAFEWEVGDEVMIDSYAGRSLDLPGTDMTLVIARFGEIIGKFLIKEADMEPEPAEEPPQIWTPPSSGLIVAP